MKYKYLHEWSDLTVTYTAACFSNFFGINFKASLGSARSGRNLPVENKLRGDRCVFLCS